MVKEMQRRELKLHRESIREQIKEYARKACEVLGVTCDLSSIKLNNILKSTRIRLPSEIVPDEFVKRILEENGKKRYVYKINFCQREAGYIEIHLPGKPLLTDGFGIMMFFFRELLQYAERCETKKPSK